LWNTLPRMNEKSHSFSLMNDITRSRLPFMNGF
jgi:hypothetical protein